jgi:uncharacterized membrane protein
MPKKKSVKKDDKRLFAFLATFLSIVGFVIALIAKRDDEYVMFYAKQSLVVFIIGAIAGAVQMMVSFIPIIGGIISFALTVVVVIAWLFTWIYALSDEKRDVPIVGDYAKKINL